MKQDTLEGRAKTKNGVIRLCFSVLCILLEAAFIIIVITRLNEYAEIVNLLTRVFAGILVLALYASNQTSSMKMPWIILILVFPIMGVALYLLIGLNGGTRKMRERYADIDRKLLPLLPDNREKLENIKNIKPARLLQLLPGERVMVTFDYLLKRGKDVLEEEEITLDEAIAL